MNMAGALIRLEIDARSPVEVQVAFTRDFQLMWPASMGTAWAQWHESSARDAFRGRTARSIAGCSRCPAASCCTTIIRATTRDRRTPSCRWASSKVMRNACLPWRRRSNRRWMRRRSRRDLTARAGEWEKETDADFAQYLDRTVSISVPDKQIQSAYDWARISLRKTLADNPLLGKGLMAGIGGSKGAYRPGYGWFFGRDSFWCSLALTAEGDYETARAAIAFISHFQRADGKIPHEISQSASLTQWFDKYPWAYSSADGTPLFVIALEDYVSGSGDDAFLGEQWEHARKAMEFWRSTLTPDGWPKNQGVGHGWVEGGAAVAGADGVLSGRGRAWKRCVRCPCWRGAKAMRRWRSSLRRSIKRARRSSKSASGWSAKGGMRLRSE